MWVEHDGQGQRHYHHVQIDGTADVNVTTHNCDDGSGDNHDRPFPDDSTCPTVTNDDIGAHGTDPSAAQRPDPSPKPRTPPGQLPSAK